MELCLCWSGTVPQYQYTGTGSRKSCLNKWSYQRSPYKYSPSCSCVHDFSVDAHTKVTRLFAPHDRCTSNALIYLGSALLLRGLWYSAIESYALIVNGDSAKHLSSCQKAFALSPINGSNCCINSSSLLEGTKFCFPSCFLSLESQRENTRWTRTVGSWSPRMASSSRRIQGSNRRSILAFSFNSPVMFCFILVLFWRRGGIALRPFLYMLARHLRAFSAAPASSSLRFSAAGTNLECAKKRRRGSGLVRLWLSKIRPLAYCNDLWVSVSFWPFPLTDGSGASAKGNRRFSL